MNKLVLLFFIFTFNITFAQPSKRCSKYLKNKEITEFKAECSSTVGSASNFLSNCNNTYRADVSSSRYYGSCEDAIWEVDFWKSSQQVKVNKLSETLKAGNYNKLKAILRMGCGLSSRNQVTVDWYYQNIEAIKLQMGLEKAEAGVSAGAKLDEVDKKFTLRNQFANCATKRSQTKSQQKRPTKGNSKTTR